MDRIRIRHTGIRKVHFQHPVYGELTLCGLEWLRADHNKRQSAGAVTTLTVTCEKCQHIVMACTKVDANSEISPISR